MGHRRYWYILSCGKRNVTGAKPITVSGAARLAKRHEKMSGRPGSCVVDLHVKYKNRRGGHDLAHQMTVHSDGTVSRV